MIREPEVLCKKLGLSFHEPLYFTMALTHRSAGANNNERLEFLGDSVLGFVIAQKLFEKFPEASEGVLSRLRANLVNQQSLAEQARMHDVGDYLILGSGELKSGGYRRDSILSDALEAIMGALILDQGFEVCKQWILKLFSEKLEGLTLNNWTKDPKTLLQEHMQSRKQNLPEYTLSTLSGQAHAQTFQVECSVSLVPEATVGTGNTRKKAEQEAAERMLKMMQKEGL